ncbi:hypothetical protein N431DRAFT_214655 [Stipitochalara longipes BDJ]|nr:hypothetical protein N431DRAFT_214655 [Stipitochalara longipes BDJ]
MSRLPYLSHGACLPAGGWSHDRGYYLLLHREGKAKAVRGEAEEGSTSRSRYSWTRAAAVLQGMAGVKRRDAEVGRQAQLAVEALSSSIVVSCTSFLPSSLPPFLSRIFPAPPRLL